MQKILGYLGTLGICLWYDKLKEEGLNTLVLNPDWITNGIYKLINKGFNDHMHVLNVTDGVRLLENSEKYEYPANKVRYLFLLMREYELAFFKDDDHIFVPAILPLDQPDDLPQFEETDDYLAIRFEVNEALPPNIVSRVIVQRHTEIFDEALLWRKGAVLKYADSETTAIVEEDGRTIAVRVKGADKTAYIKSLSATLERIFDDYTGVNPKLSYKILMPDNTQSLVLWKNQSTKTYIDEEYLKMLSAQKAEYFDNIIHRFIPLAPTIEGYDINFNFTIGAINLGDNHGTITGDADTTSIDQSTNITNNFHDCTIILQGELTNLADALRKGGDSCSKDADYVDDIAATFNKVDKIVANTAAEDVAEVLHKKGIVSKVKEFYEELTDENSDLYKNTTKLRNGAKKIQSFLKVYNEVAKLIPVLPQVPDVVLNVGKN